jgi:hypothetical protein
VRDIHAWLVPLLRNELYTGQIVWRRRLNTKDPSSGATVRRDAKPESFVYGKAPHLRIIDDDLWQRVQQRRAAEAAPETPGRLHVHHAFWDRRRPRHLLSQKVQCGACGRLFKAMGKDYLGCAAAKNGGCQNTRTVRRAWLEAHVIELIGRQLMQPELLAEFLESFRTEWDRLAADLKTRAAAGQRERAALDRKISNLVDAISDGRSSPAILEKLKGLEAAKAAIDVPERTAVIAPIFQTPPVAAYARQMSALAAALERGDDPEALELARSLIEKVVVQPPRGDDDPPSIEVVGELVALLTAAGVEGADPNSRTPAADPVPGLFVSSVKAEPGAEPRPCSY